MQEGEECILGSPRKHRLAAAPSLYNERMRRLPMSTLFTTTTRVVNKGLNSWGQRLFLETNDNECDTLMLPQL